MAAVKGHPRATAGLCLCGAPQQFKGLTVATAEVAGFQSSDRPDIGQVVDPQDSGFSLGRIKAGFGMEGADADPGREPETAARLVGL